ncbi:hypothetical protein FG386_001922 [Cryptosporidium ryanae]|uniref:uncharacterized protein n=1 Tax=Cryptosporidium ryanae TaxID=515981 RepID=UPI00351A624F|nr:hypothetical protein FG386_001922 [Cryptosporidium ryanae]
MKTFNLGKQSGNILPLIALFWFALLFREYILRERGVSVFLSVKKESTGKYTLNNHIKKNKFTGIHEYNYNSDDSALYTDLNVSFLELFKKKKNSGKDKSSKKELKKLEKSQKKQDKEDEKKIKKEAKKQGIDSKAVKQKLKDLKKELSRMRTSGNRDATLMGLFQSSGGFAAIGTVASGIGSATNVAAGPLVPSGESSVMSYAGAQNTADSDGDGIPDSQEVGGMGTMQTTPLTKEEKKKQKKQDKIDEETLKNQYVSAGMTEKEAKKKVKEGKKQLKKLRKTQPRATLFTMNSQTTTRVIEGIDGSMSTAMEAIQTTPLTKEEKKKQKKQDKIDAETLKNQYVSAGMTEKEAKKKVKEEKKKLKKLRKTQPRATLLNMNNFGVVGVVGAAGMVAGAAGSPVGLGQGMQPLDLNSVGSKLSDLESRIEKLERKNKARKAQIMSLTEYVNKMAKVVKRLSVSSRSGSSLGQSFDDDDDDI